MYTPSCKVMLSALAAALTLAERGLSHASPIGKPRADGIVLARWGSGLSPRKLIGRYQHESLTLMCGRRLARGIRQEQCFDPRGAPKRIIVVERIWIIGLVGNACAPFSR